METAVKAFFFSSRRRHTRSLRDWSSDVCSSDLHDAVLVGAHRPPIHVVAEIGAGGEILLELRSEERRVGKECRSRRSPDHYKKKSAHDRCTSQNQMQYWMSTISSVAGRSVVAGT